jgi:hypothetical protein
MAYFSLFKNDRYCRFLTFLNIGGFSKKKLKLRILVFILITCIPILVLSAIQSYFLIKVNHSPNPSLLMLLLRDFAAFVQYIVFIPFCFIAEVSIDSLIRRAIGHLTESGIINKHSSEMHKFKSIIVNATQLRDSIIADLVIVVIAIILTIMLMGTLEKPNTWQWIITNTSTNEGYISWAGWWWVLINNPIVLLILFKWVWRIFIWTRLLWHISRLRLRLLAGHPDRAGGLLFLGRVQSGFGIFIFAVGSVIATVTGYKLLFEGVHNTVMENIIVWMPVFGYILLAPVCFLAPLLAFSRKLWITKERGIINHSRLAGKFIDNFEQKWLKEIKPLKAGHDVQGLASFDESFDTMLNMHLVPFDTKIVISLVTTAGSPMLPLLLNLFPELRPLLRIIGIG